MNQIPQKKQQFSFSQQQINPGLVKQSLNFKVYQQQFFPQIRQNIFIDKLNQFKSYFQTHDIVYHQNEFCQKMRYNFVNKSTNWRTIEAVLKLSYFQIKLTILNLIPKDNFNIQNLQKIGSGSFGTVLQFQNDNLFPNQNFIIKQIDFNEQSQYQLRTLLKQCALVKLFSALKIGPSYKKLFSFDIIINGKEAYFSMEKGVQIVQYLQNELRNEFYSDENSLQKELTQIQASIKQMHSLGIVHMDIKLQNLVYSQQFQKIVLIDFGLSQIKSIKPGLMQIESFKGSYHCCSQQMKNLFSSQKEQFIDVFYNDYVCWTKIKKTLLFSLKLTDKDSHLPTQIKYKYKNNEPLKLNQFEKFIFIFMALFDAKYMKNNQEKSSFYIVLSQSLKRKYLKCLKIYAQNIFCMLDEQSQIDNIFKLFQELNIDLVFQDRDELMKKYQIYNKQTSKLIRNRFLTIADSSIYDMSLSLMFQDMSPADLSIQLEWIVMYHKLIQKQNCVNIQYVNRFNELTEGFAKLYDQNEQQFYQKQAQNSYQSPKYHSFLLNLIFIQNFTKVLSDFSVEKIINTQLLKNFKNSVQYLRDKSKLPNLKQNISSVKNYSLKKFCFIVLIGRQISCKKLQTIEQLKRKSQIHKILKGFISQCDKLALNLKIFNDQNHGSTSLYTKFTKLSVQMINQWILAEYVKILTEYNLQIKQTKDYQASRESLDQIYRIQCTYTKFIQSKPLLFILVQYQKIIYELYFLPSSTLKLKKVFELKELWLKIIKQKIHISTIQFQKLFSTMLYNLICEFIKCQNFQQAYFCIRTSQKLIDNQNQFLIDSVKYKLAQVFYNNQQMYCLKNRINNRINKINQAVQPFPSHFKPLQQRYHKQKFLKKGLDKQFPQRNKNCSIDQIIFLLSIKINCCSVTVEQKNTLMNQYETYYHMTKKQIENFSKFFFQNKSQQVKIIRLFQVEIQHLIILFCHVKDSQKASFQRQKYLKFVAQNQLHDSIRYYQAEYRFNKLYANQDKNQSNLFQSIKKYFVKALQNNFENCKIQIFVELLNQEVTVSPKHILKSQLYEAYLRVFNYLISNKKICFFFKFPEIMSVFSKKLIGICVQNMCVNQNYLNRSQSAKKTQYQRTLFCLLQGLCQFVNIYPCENYSKYLIQINKQLKTKCRQIFQNNDNDKATNFGQIYHQQLCSSISSNQIFSHNLKEQKHFKLQVQELLFKCLKNISKLNTKGQIIIFFLTIAKHLPSKDKSYQIIRIVSKCVPFVTYNTYCYILTNLYSILYFTIKSHTNQWPQSYKKNKLKSCLIKMLRKNASLQSKSKVKKKLMQKQNLSFSNFQKLIFNL